MKLHIFVMPLLALSALGACFMSQAPRIMAGVPVADGPILLCAPTDPCVRGDPQGDGYLMKSDTPNEPDMPLRFELLTEAGGVPVYLGEMELRDEDDAAWMYLVARRSGDTAEGLPRFDIKLPDCADTPPDTAPVPGIERVDGHTCHVTDIAALRAFLIDAHASDFSDDAWWADED